MNDLIGVIAPTALSWTNVSGLELFIELYDWDTVTLNPSAPAPLISQIRLCTGIFPCRLSIYGNGGMLLRGENGSFECLWADGCTAMYLNSVAISCNGFLSLYSVFFIDGSELTIDNSSFTSCASWANGGIIQSFGNASVTVVSSFFVSILSSGFGGAVSAVGGTLLFSDTVFSNCSSVTGGGAISVTAFYCAGSSQNIYTTVTIDACRFKYCSSKDSGGAVIISGSPVNVLIFGSEFTSCISKKTGGAISTNEESSLLLSDSMFLNNSAAGIGGGAISVDNAALIYRGLQGVGNTANSGGGGVLFWSGGTEPLIQSWCSSGYAANFSAPWFLSTPTCVPCPPGTFQTGQGMSTCAQCDKGTFSTANAAASSVTCESCSAGTYSDTFGADSSSACAQCKAGTYSDLKSALCQPCAAGTYFSASGCTALSSCSICAAGTYSSALGSVNHSSCRICPAGKYSTYAATECSACRAGTYSTATGATSYFTCIKCEPGTFSSSEGSQNVSDCSLCPVGTYGTSKYYTYHMDAITWADAEAACACSGGHLASIENSDENDMVLSLVPAYHDYWIGYHFSSENSSWIWSDGTKSEFSNWGDVNPKNGTILYSCADFPSYPYTTANTSGLLAYWPYFREQFGIFQQAGPFSAPAGAWYNYDCGNGIGWVVGYVCSFTGTTACFSCDSGKYSTSLGASSSDSCTLCSDGCNQSFRNTSLQNISQRKDSTLRGYENRFFFLFCCCFDNICGSNNVFAKQFLLMIN